MSSAIMCFCLPNTLCALCYSAALIFNGSVNPAHPKHIGSIDPSCDVVEVVKGNQSSSQSHSNRRAHRELLMRETQELHKKN